MAGFVFKSTSFPFEVAKALKKKEWLELANAEYNK